MSDCTIIKNKGEFKTTAKKFPGTKLNGCRFQHLFCKFNSRGGLWINRAVPFRGQFRIRLKTGHFTTENYFLLNLNRFCQLFPHSAPATRTGNRSCHFSLIKFIKYLKQGAIILVLILLL